MACAGAEPIWQGAVPVSLYQATYLAERTHGLLGTSCLSTSLELQAQSSRIPMRRQASAYLRGAQICATQCDVGLLPGSV